MLKKEFILEQLEKYCTLDESLCEGTFYEQIVCPLQDADCFDNDSWTYDSGVSKGVLIFNDLDYVIKIPFYCEYEEECGFYDENDEWVSEGGGPLGEPFMGVAVEGFCKENEWDYCETEELRYKVAKKHNVENYFAETWHIGTVCGWPVYAQVKCCMYRSEESHSIRSRKNYSEQDRERARSARNATKLFVDEEWLIDFLQYWGEECFKDLAQFCEEWLIDDLHPGNLGYVCGVPCLVDYSSYDC